MEALSEFIAMDGYAAYVWPAYGAALLLLGGVTFFSLRRARQLKKELEAAEQAQNQG